MAYVIKPDATDRIKDSQSVIKDNFSALDTALSVNHVALNSADQGKHKWITLTDQTATVPPVPVIGATEASIFYSTVGGVKDLYVQKGTGAPQLIAGATGGFGVNNWVKLSNGLIIKWCQALANGLTTITWTTYMPVGTPTFNNVFHVQACPYVIDPAFGTATNRFVQVVGELNDPLTIQVFASERTTMNAAQTECSILAIGN